MATPLTDSIEALTDYINEVTGGSDDNLSDAIATLADGYGSGGISIDDFVNGSKPTGIVRTNATSMDIGGRFHGSSVTEFHAPLLVDMAKDGVSNCTTLQVVDCPLLESVGSNAFYGCTSLSSVNLPKLGIVAGYSFYNNKALTYIKLLHAWKFNGASFQNCTSLKTVVLPNATVIDKNVFSNCTAITDIYVPNAESSYSNAPWGATNATIHYNTQFDANGDPILE